MFLQSFIVEIWSGKSPTARIGTLGEGNPPRTKRPEAGRRVGEAAGWFQSRWNSGRIPHTGKLALLEGAWTGTCKLGNFWRLCPIELRA